MRTKIPLVLLLLVSEAQSAPIAWIASSLSRVGRTDAAGSSLRAEIAAARGEYESFQVIVQAPAGGLSNVNVWFGDLQSADGNIIPSSALIPYREHYVYVSASSPDLRGSNRPNSSGWYADGLIPFYDPDSGAALSGALSAAPFNVSPGENQPIWVDVLIPREAIAGMYRGAFEVSSTEGNVSGEILLRVFNFTLPLKPSLRSSFLLWNDTGLAASRELLRHRLQPLRVDVESQRYLIENYGLSSVGLPFWSRASSSRCAMASPPSSRAFQASADRQDPELWRYVYSVDEIDRCPNLFETVKQWGRSMHEAGINNLVTVAPTPELYDDGSGSGRSAIDVWVELPVMYDRSTAEIAEVLRKGDQVWSYNTLVQDSYSPKWLIDYSPMDFRIQPGFINQSLGLTGLLYWRVDLWSSDPWNVINAWGNGRYPGEGMLLYPGGDVGLSYPVASMRLKWLRDGVDDYEYIQILRDLGQGDAALEVSRSVASDWHNWTRDPNQLEFGRLLLAEKIEQMTSIW